ncbi:MAG TPA: thioredoxin family protein [Methylophilaceae bacterium]|nr:thioredoxin family protein [Methylophilaceae bacterium]
MKTILSTLSLLTFLFSASVQADSSAYTQAKFDALQKEGKPILVAIHANWCPTCRAQAKIIAPLLDTAKYKSVTGLRVDFDDQKDIVRHFKATQQSTLIVFKDGKEVGRITGETSTVEIEKLVQKTL